MAAVTHLDSPLTDEIVRRIVNAIRLHKIILFGSRARGEARPDSDIDLLVIAPSAQPRYRRAAPLLISRKWRGSHGKPLTCTKSLP